MNRYIIKIIFLLLISAINLFPQFGKNKVQYKDFSWYYIQTNHFDIYFSQDGKTLTEFTAKIAEESIESIQKSFDYSVNNRITIIVFNSTNDFQETNVIDSYLPEGIEGFTELFKNRVVIQFHGSYQQFEHLIHHELVHAVINDMFYGGSLQNIISNNITLDLPIWFNEGMAEYQALGWDVDTDMFIRDAATNEYLPDIQNLNGYFAYRGGQSVFYYISQKYGEQKISELINKIKSTGNFEDGLKESIGITLKELNERWKKDIKKTFWPDVAIRKDPDEFAKRLTDPEEDGGFYNTSPAISPQGDKIVFISNRDYYFDVYLMDAIDGKVVKKLVEGNRNPDFEELNILTPGISWSPDGSKIALSAKSNGWDVIYLIDVESEDKEILPFTFEGIHTVAWSPDGKDIAFIGQTATQTDVYIYNIESKQLTNVTNDIFSDLSLCWSNDAKKIFFSSDRDNYLRADLTADSVKIKNHNYSQTDIYSIELLTKKIIRLTDTPISKESSPVCSADGSELLFISDLNGINNIYKLNFDQKNDPIPITNSISGIYQLSTSTDGKKLTFSSLYESSFNIFLLTNPFDEDLELDELPKTKYIAKLLGKDNEKILEIEASTDENDSSKIGTMEFFTGNYVDTTKVYGNNIQVDFGNYVFGKDSILASDSLKELAGEKIKPVNNLDENGNYYVNKYKITFSPDLIYANAGYSTLYGLLGTTVLSFSDVLGNHKIIGLTSLQIDLKNSDYGLAYYYLPKRINLGIEMFHTARFVYLTRGFSDNLFRFRNLGISGSVSYPINRFYRIDAGLSWLNLSSENLDDPSEPTDKVSYVIPSASFVHDNVLWGYTSPVDGTRYRFDLLGNPGIGKTNLSFYSILGDYRTYWRFWNDYSFAFRLSGGYSGGANPQRFFIGGIENWINRNFASTTIPLESASDFAFLTPALPLRGFDYAEQIGTKYSLMNLELRFPLIRYLLTGALPFLFSNVVGVVFADIGTAWNRNQDLKFFEKDINNNIVSRDLLMGTGVGARLYLLYFLVRFDVAWAYNVDKFSSPKFYISIGADF
ncbi:MAG: PD40 domain-containing protein [Ignavibacteriales bacterium]|nr:PD40 domain-containing protein [Ignavibacteriales bacterium]